MASSPPVSPPPRTLSTHRGQGDALVQPSNIDYRLRDDFLTSDFNSPLSFSPIEWADEGAPAINWLVDGCFIAGTVALLSSDGGLGKSLLMQQLCTAAALGLPWLGMKTKRIKSWALFCEDDKDELRRRQEKINRHYGCSMGDLDDVNYRSRAGQYNVMAEFQKWEAIPVPTKLFLASVAKTHQIGAQLIILDTASDVFGGNEIAKDQVRAFITMLRRWAMQANACVILTAHVSNEGLSSGSGLSGSRAWSNSVRSRLWLTDGKKNESGNKRQLRGMKQNYAARNKPLDLAWSDGVFKKIETQPTHDYTEPSFAADWPGG